MADTKAEIEERAAALQEILTRLGAGLVERGHADKDQEFDPVDTALAALDLQADEIKGLESSIRGYKSAATRAKGQAAAAEARLPAKPRRVDLGALRSHALPPAELLERIEKAKVVAVTFVDAEGSEFVGVAPREISGDAFRDRGHALQLNVPSLPLRGPAGGAMLAGYVLLLDDKPAAFAPRIDVFKLAANHQVELKDDVSFPAAFTLPAADEPAEA